MTPTIVTRGDEFYFTVGVPGGRRIFGAVAQAISNVVDHGMTLQEAAEAPRVWTQGQEVEVEDGFADVERLRRELELRGHSVLVVPAVADCMNGAMKTGDGLLHGAACWRGDGTPMGISGGPAGLSGTRKIEPDDQDV
jgi:gamma-glutamyltranspeptidase/glutathione hydrolase